MINWNVLDDPQLNITVQKKYKGNETGPQTNKKQIQKNKDNIEHMDT